MDDKPDPVAVFAARCEARAMLWAAGEIDLHEAVDMLQAHAEDRGLVRSIGNDKVLAVMATAFAAVRHEPQPLEQPFFDREPQP